MLINISIIILSSCATGAYATFTKTTPAAPKGCIEGQVRPNKNNQNMAPAVFKIYPNPASKQISIEYPVNQFSSDLSASIYDLLGQKIITWSLPAAAGMVSEDVPVLPSGLYLYVINTGNDIVARGKLMIQQ